MRVISGTAKGRRLKQVPGDTTRPIMDRAKENLFNLLGDVAGERWLDLFGGTGQVGIEALSRGAAEVVFIDKVRPAIRTIESNLKTTKLTDRAEVVQMDAFTYLRGFNKRPFHLVYVAPPQYKKLWIEAMEILDQNPTTFLTERGIVVVQIDPKEFEDLSLNNLSMYEKRKYGNTLFCFYEQL